MDTLTYAEKYTSSNTHMPLSSMQVQTNRKTAPVHRHTYTQTCVHTQTCTQTNKQKNLDSDKWVLSLKQYGRSGKGTRSRKVRCPVCANAGGKLEEKRWPGSGTSYTGGMIFTEGQKREEEGRLGGTERAAQSLWKHWRINIILT